MSGNISSLLEEKDQEWYFLCKEIELFERFTICSAPPVGFVAKDGFGEFRDFGQFWRAADDFARLVMLPCALPQTNLLRSRIGIVYVSVHTLILVIVSSWFEILTPLPKSVCINKARARAQLTVMGIFYPNRPQIWKMRGRAKMVSLSHRRNVLIKEVDQYHLIAFFCWICTAVHCTWGPPKIFLFLSKADVSIWRKAADLFVSISKLLATLLMSLLLPLWHSHLSRGKQKDLSSDWFTTFVKYRQVIQQKMTQGSAKKES